MYSHYFNIRHHCRHLILVNYKYNDYEKHQFKYRNLQFRRYIEPF
jgi:hypothetical protein